MHTLARVLAASVLSLVTHSAPLAAVPISRHLPLTHSRLAPDLHTSAAVAAVAAALQVSAALPVPTRGVRHLSLKHSKPLLHTSAAVAAAVDALPM